MAAVIWIGVAVTLLGVAGLIWCIRLSLRVAKPGQDAGAGKAALQKVLAWNMASVCVAFVGLMIVVVGIILR